MFRASAWLCSLSIVLGAGCDLVVAEGDVTVLGNAGSVFGSATPNAVSVLPGGTVGVEDADLFGRGRVITQGMSVVPSPGAGLVADRAEVVIVGGRVLGGNVIVQASTSGVGNPTPGNFLAFETPSPAELAAAGVVGIPLAPDPSARPFGSATQGPLLAPGLVAQGALVVIDGGVVMSSGVFGSQEFYQPVPALVVNDSVLVITGGEFRLGPLTAPVQLGRVVAATFSDVDISGGHFADGPVLLQNSRAVITGGRFDRGFALGNFVPLRSPPPLLAAPGCTEIRGGQFPFVGTFGSAEQVFIFGTSFNLPFGPISLPPPPPLPFPLPTNVVVNPTLVGVTGTLEDGTTLTFLVGSTNGPARFVLARPGSPGCD